MGPMEPMRHPSYESYVSHRSHSSHPVEPLFPAYNSPHAQICWDRDFSHCMHDGFGSAINAIGRAASRGRRCHLREDGEDAED